MLKKCFGMKIRREDCIYLAITTRLFPLASLAARRPSQMAAAGGHPKEARISVILMNG